MSKTVDVPAINGQQILSMKADLAAEKFFNAIREMKFPKERLSDNWKNLAGAAIQKATPLSLRLSLKEFLEAFEADVDNLNMFEFGCLSNAIEVISFHDAFDYAPSHFTHDEYEDVYIQTVREALTHIEYYNLETKKLRIKIEKEVDTEVAMKVAAMNGSSTSTINPLKPVIGEA